MTFLNLNHRPDDALRREVIATAQKMNMLGINQGKSGNVSARAVDGSEEDRAGFWVTPTGIPYEKLTPDDIVKVRMDGGFSGSVLPSSEWRFHRDIYAARPEVHAIVHTHSTFATTIAVHGKEIPAFHYMIAVGGGDNIRCAPYATFGTQELSDHVVRALEGRTACLMAQHGMIACGVNLEKALALAVEVESLARMYWQALQIGEPPLLDAAEMRVVIEKFKTYGQQPSEGNG
jgi:L-fuculose-phosphate aldolase